jgi:ATP-dependent Clp endopeptidase proteolytic subunit ClpP
MSDTPLLSVRGVIGQDFSLHQTDTFLAQHPEASHLKVVINSPGGDVGVGAAIYKSLLAFREKGGTVEVLIEEMAASMGTIIAMAASPGMLKAAGPFTLFMVHKPLVPELEMMNADDLRHVAEQLDEIEKPFVSIYAERTGKSPQEIEQLMRKELYMTAQTAQEWGFIDEILHLESTPAQEKPLKAVAFFTPTPEFNPNDNSMTEQQEHSLVEKVVSAVAHAFGLKPRAETHEDTPAEEVPQGQVSSVNSDQGPLYFEGESLEVGTLVFTDEALETAAGDGDYVLDSGDTAQVTEGQVTEIVAAEEEAPAEADPAEQPEANAAIVALQKEVKALKAKVAAQATPSVPGSGNPVAQAPQNFTGTPPTEEAFAASARNIVNSYTSKRRR